MFSVKYSAFRSSIDGCKHIKLKWNCETDRKIYICFRLHLAHPALNIRWVVWKYSWRFITGFPCSSNATSSRLEVKFFIHCQWRNNILHTCFFRSNRFLNFFSSLKALNSKSFSKTIHLTIFQFKLHPVNHLMEYLRKTLISLGAHYHPQHISFTMLWL